MGASTPSLPPLSPAGRPLRGPVGWMLTPTCWCQSSSTFCTVVNWLPIGVVGEWAVVTRVISQAVTLWSGSVVFKGGHM